MEIEGGFSPTFEGALETITDVIIRHLIRDDLPGLEWEGEYTRYRRVFTKVYRNARMGRAVLWVAVLPSMDILGQVFVQLNVKREKCNNGIRGAYLHSIRVRQQYRNLGLGSRLLSVAENDLREREFTHAFLNVARDNKEAIRFYERHGYLITAPESGRWFYIDHEGRRCDIYEPAWRMEKKL